MKLLFVNNTLCVSFIASLVFELVMSSLDTHREASEQSSTKSKPEFQWTGAELVVCAILQLVLVFLAYRLEKSDQPTIISESAWAIFFGLVFGSVLAMISPNEAGKAGLDPQVFFYGLLPPIILEAGFSMKKRGFFANFFTILSLAIVGTFIATFITGGLILMLGKMGIITKLPVAEAFLYGSLISAVDPVATLSVFKKCDVNPLLFNLVFGESVLNDGVAIVSFSLFQDIVRNGDENFTFNVAFELILRVFGIGFGSVLLAGFVCFSSAFLLKSSDSSLKEFPSFEISIILLSAYLSYFIADLAGLSGIVALFFSGVLMSHYHFYTISSESATALTHLLSTLSFLAENFIFLYLGVSVVAYSGFFKWDFGFIFMSIIICVIARAFNTFPLCTIANYGRRTQIPINYMIVIWFSGLRGAIAFALALNVWTPDPSHAKVIESSTLFTVMFTTLFFGMGITPLLQFLGLSRTRPSSRSGINDLPNEMENFLSDQDRQSSVESDIAFHDDKNLSYDDGIHGLWERLDETYLKPLFGGNSRSSAKFEMSSRKQNPNFSQ